MQGRNQEWLRTVTSETPAPHAFLSASSLNFSRINGVSVDQGGPGYGGWGGGWHGKVCQLCLSIIFNHRWSQTCTSISTKKTCMMKVQQAVF